MSENIGHESVAEQIMGLATLGETSCDNFQHQLIGSKVNFAGPGAQSIFNIMVAENTALVITGLDIKVLYDTSDAALAGGDFRSTDDLNPYGPYVGIGAVGMIDFLLNGSEKLFATAFDFSVINRPILFVISGGKSLVISVNPLQPLAKNITLVSTLTTFIVVPEIAATEHLSKKNSRIVTATNVP